MGILNVKGSYLDFLKSLQNYTVVPDVSLDDLSGVLPLDKTKDPTLEVDTDPSIVIPTDAVTVEKHCPEFGFPLLPPNLLLANFDHVQFD